MTMGERHDVVVMALSLWLGESDAIVESVECLLAWTMLLMENPRMEKHLTT